MTLNKYSRFYVFVRNNQVLLGSLWFHTLLTHTHIMQITNYFSVTKLPPSSMYIIDGSIELSSKNVFVILIKSIPINMNLFRSPINCVSYVCKSIASNYYGYYKRTDRHLLPCHTNKSNNLIQLSIKRQSQCLQVSIIFYRLFVFHHGRQDVIIKF